MPASSVASTIAPIGSEKIGDGQNQAYGFPIINRLERATFLSEWPAEFLSVSRTYRAGFSRHETNWKPVDVTMRKLYTAFVKPTITDVKDGFMFFGGSLRRKNKKNENVTAQHVMAFDCDNGQTVADAVAKLQAFGACYVLYTSHSHLKAHSKESILQAEAPTLADLQAIMKEKGLWQYIIDSAKITSATLENDRWRVEYDHAPIHKFRVVMPLAESFVIGDSLADSARDWRAAYTHVARAIGLDFDQSGPVMCRAFYRAAARTLEGFECVVGGTTPLVFPDVDDAMREAAGCLSRRERKERGEASADVARIEGTPDADEIAFLYPDLDIVGFLDALGWEQRGSGSQDKQAYICPNDFKHGNNGNPTDAAFVAMHSDITQTGGFVLACQHGSCKNLRTGDLLQAICNAVATTSPDYEFPDPAEFSPDYEPDLEQPANDDEEGGDALEQTVSASKQAAPQLKKTQKLLQKAKAGFSIVGDIIFFKDEDDLIPVCKGFEAIDLARDFEGNAWSLRVAFNDYDGNVHTHRIPLADLEKRDSGVAPALAGMGLKIHSGRHLPGLLKALEPNERTLIVAKPGWVDGERFVAPDGVAYGASGGEGLELDNPLPPQRAGTIAGQLEAWRIALEYGAAHHFVGMLASVSGALVQYADLDASPIITLSGKSSAGKTTALMLAASGFGCPDIKKKGLIHTLRGTDNAFEYLAARSTGTFLGLDETAHLDPASLERLVFMIASGHGKNRMRADASERQGKDWSTFCMLTSEQAAGGLVEKAGKVANVGFAARMADIDVSHAVPIPLDKYLSMTALLKGNYGHIGPAFVETLAITKTITPALLREQIDAKAAALADKDAPALLQRSAGVFAVLWQAGELLATFGILPELTDGGGLEYDIRRIWGAYAESDEAKALAPAEQAIDTLRETLYARQGGDVKNLRPEEGARSGSFAEAVAWYENDVAGTTFFVRTNKITGLAGDTLKRRTLTAALLSAAILKPMNEKSVAHSRLPNGEQVQHYRLTFAEGGVEY